MKPIDYTKVKGGVRPACHRRKDMKPWLVCRRCGHAYLVFAPGAQRWLWKHRGCQDNWPWSNYGYSRWRDEDPIRVYSDKRVRKGCKAGKWRRDFTLIERLALAGLE